MTAYRRSREPGLIDPAAVGPAYWAEVLSDSPLALWKLAESSGSTMVDSSGNGYDGTYTDAPTLGHPSLIEGVGDTCASFTPNDHATVADAEWMDVNNLTVEAVVVFDDLSSNRGVVARDSGGGSSRDWKLYGYSNGNLYAGLLSPGGSGVEAGAPVSTGTAHHVAMVHDGSTLKLFIDGSLEASTTAAFNTRQNAQAIHVGRYSSAYHRGEIQGVAIYGEALSSARILAHAAAGGFA